MTQIVTVLGAGYAGCTAVLHLEDRLPDDAKLVWVSEHSHHFVLHKAHELIREPSKESKYVVPVHEIKDTDTMFVNGRVDAVKQDEIQIESGNTVPYDKLIVALGSQTADYGIPGVFEYGHTLKGRSDAVGIHRAVRDEMMGSDATTSTRVVIGGAGLSGVQAAGEVAALRDLHDADVEVTLVEALDTILPNSDESFQSKVREELDNSNITVQTDTPVQEVTEDEVRFSGGGSLPHDVFVWTGGITGPEALTDAPFETQDCRGKASSTLKTTNDGVFAIGDAAVIDDDTPVPPTAQAARQAGKVAAINVVREMNGEDPIQWQYTDRGTLVSVGDSVIAHNIPYSPFDTFGGRTARMLKRGVTEAWVKSLTADVQFFNLLPTPMKDGQTTVEPEQS